ncbi:DUF4355 domain-containing protein [Fructobacillus tropaeoli]|uniref:DUF4355 domain-containing protein n=1 Tax=Fructobacillus tropaeoli TaxID=709323 RepID=A0ABN9YK84_9LACO|nr:DUF4355 domain-containing protein [Fructobacillus tropaeoli]GIC70609.1 DUF4355 domain-containing protein [Fructobacillus tropaeoli]CAK1228521.1 hypothetical protein R53137_KAKDMLNK_00236 [Fructobacillus tropaeoli]CAK1234932.1 hypothetical protein LMG30238_FMBOGHMB_00629 [Fructobacillus tropaeoli]
MTEANGTQQEDQQNIQGGQDNQNQGEQGVEDENQNNTQDDKVTLTKAELNSRLDRAAKSNQKKAIEEALNAYKEKQKEEENEAKRLKGMSAEEKANELNKKLEEENRALKMKMARNEMTAEARKQITEKGVEVDDHILDLLVTDEADTTNANIEAYSEAVNRAAENLFKKSRQGNSLGHNVGNGGAGSESEATRLAKRQKELNDAAKNKSSMFKRS